jgi:Kef-type K+ transport system membrane component KefB
VKLLSDKRELEQLHGRIAVGFLIVQDIVVVLVMIALTAFGRRVGDNLAADVALVFAKGLGLLAGMALLMRYVLPRLLHQVARSQELLFLFGVAYAVSVATLSDWLGFSSEIGAFLAGVSLATTPYRDALGARLVSLRDSCCCSSSWNWARGWSSTTPRGSSRTRRCCPCSSSSATR